MQKLEDDITPEPPNELVESLQQADLVPGTETEVLPGNEQQESLDVAQQEANATPDTDND